MALIVEDGTGKADAESYVSVADADAYHTRMANAAWTGTDGAKEAALRRATQYIDTTYRFQGSRVNSLQALEWPRYDVYIGDVYQQWPVARVIHACCELAVRALAGDLSADTDGRSVTQETVGPISVSYSDPGIGAGQTKFTLVDKMLSAFTGGGSSRVRLDRA